MEAAVRYRCAVLAVLAWASLAGCSEAASPAGLAASGGAAADSSEKTNDSSGGSAADAAVVDAATSGDGAGPADSAGSDAPGKDATDAGKPDSSAADTKEIEVPKVVCGDKFCGVGETCASCDYDCGQCQVSCGDSLCVPGENCTSCPADCGKCGNECGNGSCEPGENCATCKGDCGACGPNCGDSSCGADENCDTCPMDCGKCFEGNCDPYTSKPCKPEDQCYPYSGGELVCIAAGTKTKGQACKALVDCQKGLLCINAACNTICDATGKTANGCSSGGKCVEIGQPGKPSAGVGVCL